MAGSIHTGHRQRLKTEFLTRGLVGLADHRVLELLLFYAIPQGDVNPLAHALIARFGSLAGVFDATYEELIKVKGVGPNVATLIALLPAVAARYLEQSARVGDEFVTTWQFRDLMMPMYLGARNEKAYLLCLDGKQKLLAIRELGEGINNAVVIEARKVMEAALSCNTAKAVLVHNHISGIAMYSAADLATTKEVYQMLKKIGIELIDHLIIANDDMVSMRESGVLADLAREY